MTVSDPIARKMAVHYRCSTCSRSFVALGEASAETILCACGAPLSLGPLPGGIHELRSMVSDDARATIPMHAEGPPSVAPGRHGPAQLAAR